MDKKCKICYLIQPENIYHTQFMRHNCYAFIFSEEEANHHVKHSDAADNQTPNINVNPQDQTGNKEKKETIKTVNIYRFTANDGPDAPNDIYNTNTRWVHEIVYLQKYIGCSRTDATVTIGNFRNTHRTLKLYKDRFPGNSILLLLSATPLISQSTHLQPKYKYLFCNTYIYTFDTEELITTFTSVIIEGFPYALGLSATNLYLFMEHAFVPLGMLKKYPEITIDPYDPLPLYKLYTRSIAPRGFHGIMKNFQLLKENTN